MPIENLEEEGLEKNPDLQLAQSKFLLTLPEFKNDRGTHAKIWDGIKKDGKWNDLCLCFDKDRFYFAMYLPGFRYGPVVRINMSGFWMEERLGTS